MQKNITIVAIALLIFIGLIWIAKPADSQNPSAATTNGNIGANLTASETSYDFGRISMAAGKVKHDYNLTNSTDQPIEIKKIYTSCMCTTATLRLNNWQLGPYGMPGHGAVPAVNQVVAPGESLMIEAEFDPAAHGPAGIGQINRSIFVETASGDPLELQFKTFVTP